MFYIGQPVRITGTDCAETRCHIGKETTVTGPREEHVSGRFGYRTALSDALGGIWAGHWEGHLAPLIDPKALEFLAKIRKLKPLREKVPA